MTKGDDLFRDLLTVTAAQHINSKGLTKDDFIYEQAEEVVPSSMAGYVNVRHRGVSYPTLRVTWGALDGDKNKSTVLMQADDGLWYKLWFYDSKSEG